MKYPTKLFADNDFLLRFCYLVEQIVIQDVNQLDQFDCVFGAIDTYQLAATDGVLQFASISFDASIEEIFPTLLTGARLALREECMLADARAVFPGIR